MTLLAFPAEVLHHGAVDRSAPSSCKNTTLIIERSSTAGVLWCAAPHDGRRRGRRLVNVAKEGVPRLGIEELGIQAVSIVVCAALLLVLVVIIGAPRAGLAAEVGCIAWLRCCGGPSRCSAPTR